MKIRTFYTIALLVGLVSGSILVAHLIASEAPWIMPLFAGLIPLVCLTFLFINRDSEFDEIKWKLNDLHSEQNHKRDERERTLVSEHAKVVEQLTNRAQTFQAQHGMVIAKIAELVKWVYSTTQPTNETMRKIRRDLVNLAINELKTGVPTTILTDNVHPHMIRDVVEAAIKSGELDLAKGDKWVGELVQFALADKPAPQASTDTPAA